jgi:hypothetical protein
VSVPALQGQQDQRQDPNADQGFTLCEVPGTATAGAAGSSACGPHPSLHQYPLQVRLCAARSFVGLLVCFCMLFRQFVTLQIMFCLCRGEQTRLCGPGDIVTVAGMFLTVSL